MDQEVRFYMMLAAVGFIGLTATLIWILAGD
jgi:hypothetical protein